MRRGRTTSNPPVAQQQRMDDIKEIGGIGAQALGLAFVPCEFRHVPTGCKHRQKRCGHGFGKTSPEHNVVPPTWRGTWPRKPGTHRPG